MKTTKKQVEVTLVLGLFRKEDVIGQLANTLKDQKPHKLSAVLQSMKGKVKHPNYRIQMLREYGKKKRAFRLEVDRKKGIIRMQLSKAAMKKPAIKKVEAAEPQQNVA